MSVCTNCMIMRELIGRCFVILTVSWQFSCVRGLQELSFYICYGLISALQIRDEYEESPRKMSRVGSGDGSAMSVDKLFNENTPSPVKEAFTFQKFGMEIGTEQMSTHETHNNHRCEY